MLSESTDALVRGEGDLTRFRGIGEAIGRSIREIVLTAGWTVWSSFICRADLSVSTSRQKTPAKRLPREFESPSRPARTAFANVVF
jgi:hypothetical protein